MSIERARRAGWPCRKIRRNAQQIRAFGAIRDAVPIWPFPCSSDDRSAAPPARGRRRPTTPAGTQQGVLMVRRSAFVLMLIAIGLSAPVAFAQTVSATTGTVTGKISDE